jgi:hypothetical protein
MAQQTLSDWEDVPFFAQPADEAKYWRQTHLAPALLTESLYTPEGGDSTTITLRMDPRMLARIKRLARQRYLNYQSMIKQWLAERMEDELK